MVSHTLILSKIVGTVSLGALTGALATSTNVSLPLLLLSSPQGMYMIDSTLSTLYRYNVKSVVLIIKLS